MLVKTSAFVFFQKLITLQDLENRFEFDIQQEKIKLIFNQLTVLSLPG